MRFLRHRRQACLPRGTGFHREELKEMKEFGKQRRDECGGCIKL